MVSPQRYQIHGVHVNVAGDYSTVLEAVDAIFDHLGLIPAQGPGEAAALVLTCPACAVVPPVPLRARLTAEQDGIRAWSGGGRLYLSCAGHACRLNPSAGVAEIIVPPPPARLRKDLVTYALLVLLRRHGLYGLHASGVARGGVGCLFVAPSGSGKSTQTYSLARQGWAYLGDDALLLRARGDDVEALALRRDLCLDPALAHAFPEVRTHGRGGPFAGKGKRRLPVAELHPERLIDGCVPRLLVFPELADAPVSRVVPLRPAEALPRLMAQSAVLALDPEATPAHLRLLARLARQTRSVQLLAGRDLLARPEGVAALLEPLLDAEAA